MNLLVVVVIISVMSATKFSALGNNDMHQKASTRKTVKKCKGLWRPDKLVGKCFGLSIHSSFDELKHITNVTTPNSCRSLCCDLEDKCVSWQFEQSANECKLGGIVRLGLEVTGTPNWCDPNPPDVWNGKKLAARDNGVCTWGESLPNQCYGLGPEKLDSNKKPLGAQSCADACCARENCEMWQEMPGRGCYFGNSKGIFCDKKKSNFDGSRKCIRGYCGGLEDKILPAYYRYLNATKTKKGRRMSQD